MDYCNFVFSQQSNFPYHNSQKIVLFFLLLNRNTFIWFGSLLSKVCIPIRKCCWQQRIQKHSVDIYIYENMDYSFDIQNKSAYYFDNPNLRGTLCSSVIKSLLRIHTKQFSSIRKCLAFLFKSNLKTAISDLKYKVNAKNIQLSHQFK